MEATAIEAAKTVKENEKTIQRRHFTKQTTTKDYLALIPRCQSGQTCPCHDFRRHSIRENWREKRILTRTTTFGRQKGRKKNPPNIQKHSGCYLIVNEEKKVFNKNRSEQVTDEM
jgi:hypothetical protein